MRHALAAFQGAIALHRCEAVEVTAFWVEASESLVKESK